jgi:hypothetical protein|tara:strand:+ start:4019 stop:6001 length:1983 start_codon:yes stop_codon:yes gene_type:complete
MRGIVMATERKKIAKIHEAIYQDDAQETGSNRRGFLKSAGLVTGGVLFHSGTAHSKDIFDPTESSSTFFEDDQWTNSAYSHHHQGNQGNTAGEQFKTLLETRIDSKNMWPPENLYPDYSAAAYPQIVLPSNGLIYDDARQTYNVQYQRYPAAIFYALDTSQVQAAVISALELNLRISPAGLRNSFLSMATPDDYVVIDLSLMRSVSIDTDLMSATAGPGVIGPMINSATSESGVPGLSAASGVCGFVGAVPWTLGGGFGFQGHRLGAGCDNLLNVEIVLADGSVVQASEKENSDLFWACRGGAGGTFGIVTSIDIKLHILPNEGKIFAFELAYTGKEAFVQGFNAFQNWFPTASRLWGFDEPRLAPITSLGEPPNPYFSVLCYYWGSEEDAISELTKAGLLFDESGGEKLVRQGQWPSHQDWYFAFQSAKWMGGGGTPGTPKAVIEGVYSNTFSNPYMVLAMQNPDIMKAIYAGADVSGLPSSPFLGTQVVGGKFYNVDQYVVNRFIDPVPVKTLEKVADFLLTLSKNALAGNTAAGFIYAGGHMLGGAYADKSPTETAFYWRNKLMVLYFTFALPSRYREILGDREYRRGKRLAERFMRIFVPENTPKQAAYVNYQQESFRNWEYGYFGKNYKRLQTVKAQYDPQGMFDKQFTVNAGRR